MGKVSQVAQKISLSLISNGVKIKIWDKTLLYEVNLKASTLTPITSTYSKLLGTLKPQIFQKLFVQIQIEINEKRLDFHVISFIC